MQPSFSYAPLLGLLLISLTPLLLTADEFPVAPLSKAYLEPYGEIFQLTNRYLDIIISPENDGVVSFRAPQESNVLGAPATLLPGTAESLTAALPHLNNIPLTRWQARGWITSEGGQTVLLTQTFGPPLQLRITHMLSLPKASAALHWTTRITAIAPMNPELPLTFRLPSANLEWDAVWKIENGAELLTHHTTTDSPEGTVFQQTLLPQPALRELPPQGWTLVIDGTLSFPLTESATP